MISRLLKIRAEKKRKKPKFKRQETWKLKRFKNHPKWRRPRGKRSKMRTKEGAKPKLPSIGYRSPKEVRGFHPSGLKEVRVENLFDVEKVDAETIVRISGRIGNRKKIEVVKALHEKKIRMCNPSIKFAFIGSVSELEELAKLKKYIKKFILPKNIAEEEREDISSKAEELGIELG